MAAKNRVWDTELTGTVIWRTQKPDTTGIEYPGPGTFDTHTSDYTVIRDTRNSSTLVKNAVDDDEQADALWTLNGNMLDSSGNGRNLSVLGGTEAYGVGPFEDTKAFHFDGATRLTYSPSSELFNTGSVTLEALVKPCVTNAARVWFLAFGTAGETLADNVTYSLYVEADSNVAVIHETGAGVDQILTSDFYILDSEWTHVALARDGTSGLNSVYINGYKVLSGTLSNPEGGSSGVLALGAFPSGLQYFQGLMSYVKIFNDRALSDETIRRHAFQLLPDWRQG